MSNPHILSPPPHPTPRHLMPCCCWRSHPLLLLDTASLAPSAASFVAPPILSESSAKSSGVRLTPAPLIFPVFIILQPLLFRSSSLAPKCLQLVITKIPLLYLVQIRDQFPPHLLFVFCRARMISVSNFQCSLYQVQQGKVSQSVRGNYKTRL